jgi:hypothetical protein
VNVRVGIDRIFGLRARVARAGPDAAALPANVHPMPPAQLFVKTDFTRLAIA